MTRTIVVLNALIFIIVVPYLEVSATHIFNTEWPSHARLHNVWQLLTNGALSIGAVILVFRKKLSILPQLLSLAVSGSFVLAYLLKNHFGGSMQHSDGSELLVAGINPAVVLLIVLSSLLTVDVLLTLKKGKRD